MDAMILAKASGHDVFNALDLMQNVEFLRVRPLPHRVLPGRHSYQTQSPIRHITLLDRKPYRRKALSVPQGPF